MVPHVEADKEKKHQFTTARIIMALSSQDLPTFHYFQMLSNTNLRIGLVNLLLILFPYNSYFEAAVNTFQLPI